MSQQSVHAGIGSMCGDSVEKVCLTLERLRPLMALCVCVCVSSLRVVGWNVDQTF